MASRMITPERGRELGTDAFLPDEVVLNQLVHVHHA
jgi:hypothetical protein